MSADGNRERHVSSGGSTSRSLLAGAKLANPAAWERLVMLYAPFVAACCRRWGVAEQDIADILQDVFGAVASHLERFRCERPGDTFRGWLATIARNKVRDYYQRQSREPAAAGGTEATMRLQQVFDSSHVDEEIHAGGEPPWTEVLLQALESIRSEFHERTWQAFWGVAVEGRNAADVGADLNMQSGTVRVSKSRVLQRLRRELGDLDE